MGKYLADIKYKDGIKRQRQNAFGGLERRAASGDGSIRSMRNMSADHYPLLAARKKRDINLFQGAIYNYIGFTSFDEHAVYVKSQTMCSVAGCTKKGSAGHAHVYVDGEILNDSSGAPAIVSAEKKTFARLGNYLCMWPDKKFIWFPDEEYESEYSVGPFSKFTFEFDGMDTSSDTEDDRYVIKLCYDSDLGSIEEHDAIRDGLFGLSAGDKLVIKKENDENFGVEFILDRFYEDQIRDGIYAANDFHIVTNLLCQDTDSGAFDGLTEGAVLNGSFYITRPAVPVYFGDLEKKIHFSSFAFKNSKKEFKAAGEYDALNVSVFDYFEDNSDFKADAPGHFAAGDCVEVSGLKWAYGNVSPSTRGVDVTEDCLSFIIRDISYTYGPANRSGSAIGNRLRYEFIFDDYSFPVRGAGGTAGSHYTDGDGNIYYNAGYIRRVVPDLDFVIVHNNRLWGCKGDTIYCSGLGNPFSWTNYELSTAAWTVATGTPGDFTGAVVYNNYPTFFKEDRLFRVYGNYPAQYTLHQIALPGVRKGGGGTLAVCGSYLTYAGTDGIYQYNGSNFPKRISDGLGIYREPDEIISDDDNRNSYYDTFSFPFSVKDTGFSAEHKFDSYLDIIAGTDGRRYYINLYLQNGFGEYTFNTFTEENDFLGYAFPLVCYDTYTGLWTVEDRRCLILAAVNSGDLYLLMNNQLPMVPSKVKYEDGVIVETDYSIQKVIFSFPMLCRMSYNSEPSEGFKLMAEAEEAGGSEDFDNEKDEYRLSEAVFGDFSAGYAENKAVSRINFVFLGSGTVTPFISYDGEGWKKIHDKITVDGKSRYISAVIPRRSGVFRIKLIGTGEWMMSNMEFEYYSGTDLQEN